MKSARPTAARPAEYVHRLRTRYGETDQMGRIHHANFLIYLEEARTRMLAAAGVPYNELERQGVGLVVRSVELRYRAAARFDQELDISVWVEALRGASLTLAYEVRCADELLVSASTQLACVDLSRPGAPVRLLPAEIARGLRAAQQADS
jgi:acyl-CoA thioester hydrolase